MDVRPTAIPDVLLIELDVFEDERGRFVERYNEERFAKHGLPTKFRQDSQSRSRRDVIRGLHYQLHHAQGKLVGCTRGKALDIAADIRVGSPTFGKWVGIELSDDKPQLLWIPPGFAHGYCALSDLVEIEYKCTDVYVPSDEHGVLWSDPDLRIDWPVDRPVLSKRDRELPTLRDATPDLPSFSRSVEPLATR